MLRGNQLVMQLEQLGFTPQFYRLDITDENSIKTFQEYLQKTYGD